MDNKELAGKILEYVGGKSNISSATHCITRLRITVKDKSVIKEKEIKELPGVNGVSMVGDQYQVIIGPKVADIFLEFEPLLSDPKTEDKKDKKEKKNPLTIFIETLTGIFTPILPAIIGAGLIKGILLFLMFGGWVSADSDLYKLMSIFSDSAYYFLPMLLAVSTAERFKCNKFVAMVIAGILLHPDLITMMSGDGDISLLGIPVTKTSYSHSVVPIILAIWFMSYVEKFFAKYVPNILRTILVPVLTIFVTGTVTLCVIGPIGSIVSEVLASNFLEFYLDYGVLAGAIFSGLFPAMVLIGIHNGFTPVMIQSLSTYGVDYIMGLNVASNSAQAGATFAVFTKTKNKEFKSLAGSAAFSAILGITEPALYGVTAKLKRPLIAVMIGGGVGGAIAGYFHVTATGIATGPIIGIPLFLTDTFIYFVISCVVAFIIGFVMTYILGFEDVAEDEYSDETTLQEASIEGKNDDDHNNDKNVVNGVSTDEEKTEDQEIFSPINGKVVPLEEVNDDVFSSGMMGDGIAILPKEGKVFAPFDGVVTATMPTGHALGLISNSGCELLIHVGLDTVELKGGPFTVHVEMDDVIRKGDLLMEFDMSEIKESGYEIITPVIITNTDKYSKIIKTSNVSIEVGQNLLIAKA